MFSSLILVVVRFFDSGQGPVREFDGLGGFRCRVSIVKLTRQGQLDFQDPPSPLFEGRAPKTVGEGSPTVCLF
jgi:hypothetical protein